MENTNTQLQQQQQKLQKQPELITRQMALTSVDCCLAIAPQTIEGALDKRHPSIYTFQKANGRDKTLSLIVNQLTTINVLFAVNSDGSDRLHAFKIAAEMIVEEYPDIKANEVALVIKDAAKGKLGPAYNRIDVATIMQWFRKYYEQRDEIAVNRRMQQHKALKEGSFTRDATSEDEKRYRELLKINGEKLRIERLEREHKERMEKIEAPRRKFYGPKACQWLLRVLENNEEFGDIRI